MKKFFGTIRPFDSALDWFMLACLLVMFFAFLFGADLKVPVTWAFLFLIAMGIRYLLSRPE